MTNAVRVLPGHKRADLFSSDLPPNPSPLPAFAEEFVYRGYFLNRIAQTLRGGARALWIGLGIASVMFASVHTYQGVSGVIDAGLMGLFLGTLYILTQRHFWIAILAHATIGTIGVVLMFLGKYPGL